MPTPYSAPYKRLQRATVRPRVLYSEGTPAQRYLDVRGRIAYRHWPRGQAVRADDDRPRGKSAIRVAKKARRLARLSQPGGGQ